MYSSHDQKPGIYRWSIISADTDFFQQSVSVLAADFRGRNIRPSAKRFFIKLSAKCVHKIQKFIKNSTKVHQTPLITDEKFDKKVLGRWPIISASKIGGRYRY